MYQGFIKKYNDAVKNGKIKVLKYLIGLVICNIYVAIQVDFFDVVSNGWMANYAFINIFTALVLSIVVIVNYIYINKLKKEEDETKIQEYELQGIYFGKGKYLVLFGAVAELVFFLITKKYYYEGVINREFHVLVYIIFLAFCFRYVITPFKSKVLKFVVLICTSITMLYVLGRVESKLDKIDSYKKVPTNFEITDSKKFGGKWEEYVNSVRGYNDFLVHTEVLDLRYMECMDESISYYGYNFIIYHTKYNCLRKYLVRKAFEKEAEGNILYGTFAVTDEYDTDEVKEVEELEKDGVKVFYKGEKDKKGMNQDGEYLIYNLSTIIYLTCDYKLTETQMDIIIDSMKSMEEKL